MYTIFSGGVKTHLSSSGRNKADSVTWKEEFARCQVKDWRVNVLGAQSCAGDVATVTDEYYDNSADAYQYIMTIRESFKDGRYHITAPRRNKRHGRDTSLLLLGCSFQPLGGFCKLKSRRSPVLVLKGQC